MSRAALRVESMAREEKRIWIKIRCWHVLTLEQAMLLRRLDDLRGYVEMPEWIEISERYNEYG